MEKEPKFDCLVCDGEISLEHYRLHLTVKDIEMVIKMKNCKRHLAKLEEILAAAIEEQREIERSVA